MAKAKIGIVGGSGIYNLEGLTGVKKVRISTPFGAPSDDFVVGDMEGVEVAFLPRHAGGHGISPSELPVRANIYAFKSLCVDSIISVNAVGSLKEEIAPTNLVIPDQLIDWTRGRDNTFFTNGVVGHVSLAEPFCPVLSQTLFEVATKAGAKVHAGGTYIVMEGPQFSTKAESKLYRSWGADVIGMTALPEAKLAREAEICYAILAFVTDYDCWHPDLESVTTEMILSNLRTGVGVAKKILKLAISSIPRERDCACGSALKHAIATVPEFIPVKTRRDLDLIIGKYINKAFDDNLA